ncbi:hypothetical protein H6F61_14040 [Cyanobacteria bacterium FACHB-472]|nr:hypothetical protein [Cyanobacteria bacterium FACHB-472]
MRLCEAPRVEEAIAVTVTVVSGADIEQVISEARGALTAKVFQLSGVGSPPLKLNHQYLKLKGMLPFSPCFFLDQFKSGSFFIQKLKNYFSD